MQSNGHSTKLTQLIVNTRFSEILSVELSGAELLTMRAICHSGGRIHQTITAPAVKLNVGARNHARGAKQAKPARDTRPALLIYQSRPHRVHPDFIKTANTICRLPLQRPMAQDRNMPKRSRKPRPVMITDHHRDENQSAFAALQRVIEMTEGRPEEVLPGEPAKNPAAVALGRLGGLKGGKARAEKLTPAQRKASASSAAVERWRRYRERDRKEDIAGITNRADNKH